MLVDTRIVSHLRIPLYRNGYALLISSATTSALGLFYWVLAARYYSVETVGLGSAMLSAMMLLSGISQLSLNSVLVRFVPTAGRTTSRLVIYSYLMSAAMAAVIGFIFTLGLGVWAPALRFIGASAGWQISFVLATIVWCIFALQDSVLTGLRQAVWIPFENTAFAIVKIILLVVLAGSLQTVGIFASWNVPVLLSLLPINLLIFTRLIPRYIRATGGRAAPPAPGVIARFVGGNYLGSLFFLASTTLLPVMVTNLSGASANAYFYPPWMIVTALQLVASNMSTSLTVEGAFDQSKLSAYGRRVLIQTVRLVVPIVIVVLLGAPLILQVFGPNYAIEGSALLRWLALGVLPNIWVALFVGLARVQNRSGVIMAVQGTLSVLMLGLSALLLPTFGIAGVGMAWLASQAIVALFLLPALLRLALPVTVRRSEHPSFGTDTKTMTHDLTAKQTDPKIEPAPPTWDHSDNHFVGHLLRVLARDIKAGFLRYVVFRGNKIAYLRHLGVRIGKDCDILNTVKNFGTEPWLIEIGQRVTLAEGVLLYTHDGANRVFRDRLPNSSRWGNRFGTIRILDNCFIGANAIIMPGVQIGPDSIVGAGSVVTNDVPPQTVVAGVPAQFLCSLDEYIERYQHKMIPITATDRRELRRELTHWLWGETR
jgi:acetyltransferase-like isoleucine patch superfamily enzyme/O-antigen/teichoic acid export membrane protein